MADSSTTYNLEASWRKAQFWLHGEYVRNEVKAPLFGDPVFTGRHLTASWIFSGEMRAYNRRSGVFRPVPVARSVYEGGWGAWELGVRWSDLDLSDAAVEGGEMEIWATSLNWWLSPIFVVQAQYRDIELDRFGLSGRSDGVLTRVVLVLE